MSDRIITRTTTVSVRSGINDHHSFITGYLISPIGLTVRLTKGTSKVDRFTNLFIFFHDKFPRQKEIIKKSF